MFLQDGDKFWRMPECYIRGSTIKYLRIPDEIIDMVKEDLVVKAKGRRDAKTARGGQRGRGAQRGKFFSCSSATIVLLIMLCLSEEGFQTLLDFFS